MNETQPANTISSPRSPSPSISVPGLPREITSVTPSSATAIATNVTLGGRTRVVSHSASAVTSGCSATISAAFCGSVYSRPP